MHETENVQLIRQLYDSMSRGNLDAALALMTEDVTFVVPGPPGCGAAGTWRGHAGVRDCFRTLREAQDTRTLEIREFVAERNKVVAVLYVEATVRATGHLFASDIVHLFTIRDGRIASLLDFFDTAGLVDANRA